METEIKAQIPGVDQVISDYAIVDNPEYDQSKLLVDDIFALGLSQSCFKTVYPRLGLRSHAARRGRRDHYCLTGVRFRRPK